MNKGFVYKKNSQSISKNIIANMFGRIWSMISVYIFIPLYIYFLGEEAYGLVTFFSTLQTTMNLLGLGLSKTLRREFASGDDSNDSKLNKYKLMRSVELVYMGIALLIIFICSISAEYIAGQWLNIGLLSLKIVTSTIRLMGISIGLQIITNLYSGCLFGLEFQVKANVLQIIWSLCKNSGCILLIWLIAPDVRLFYSWHIVVDILYLVILRYSTIKILRCDIPLRWCMKDLVNLKSIWKFAFGLMLISFVYVLNTQLDKAIISKYLTLTDLGAYNTAFSLGNLTSIVASAVATAAFSRFTKYFTLGKKRELNDSFLFFSKVVGLSIVVLGVFIATYSYQLLLVWTGSSLIADISRNSAFFVIIGSTFLSLQQIPYEFLLSQGNTRINNIVSLSSIPYLLIITPIFIKKMGILGAGVSWCIQMTLTTIFYLTYIHHRFIGEKTLCWLFKDIFMPFTCAIILAYLSKLLFNITKISLELTILGAITFGSITLIIIYLIFDRQFVHKGLKYIKKYL